MKAVQTLHCHGSRDSFLITSFYFGDPKVWAVLRWIFLLHFDISAVCRKRSGTRDRSQGCSRDFLALPEVVPGGCLATVGLMDEHLGPGSRALPQPGQQIQLLNVCAGSSREVEAHVPPRRGFSREEEMQQESAFSLKLSFASRVLC